MHPESATSPIWLNQTIEVNGFNGQPRFVLSSSIVFSQCHGCIYLIAVMSQLLNRRLTDWEHRWAPALHWSSLVFYQKFRQEVTDYVFDINSNMRYYRSESPGSVSYNYCPRCAAGQRYMSVSFSSRRC